MVINIIGGGLAGCEAAYFLANKNIKVRLFEMKPEKFSKAHKSPLLCELICSNSLKSFKTDTASGLLKEEMKILDSLIIEAALKTKVPAGSALAVDRTLFSEFITETLRNNKNIEVITGEVTNIDKKEITIIASGPLTSDLLADEIKNLVGEEYLYFHDAVSPIISEESLDYNSCFKGSRYDKGEDDYVNCPMSEEEYTYFYNELIEAETSKLRDFEKVFEACMPIEVMAKRGFKTLLFGPLKPVGLNDPITGMRHFAVVQLRKETKIGDMLNMVGFQTNLKWGEQKRIFSMIPALKNAEFLRYGVMHRNTYLNSPKILTKNFNMKNNENIFFAGQITGVEGYVESAASGIICAIQIFRKINKKPYIDFEQNTALGALAHYISTENKNFQPMHINFGIIQNNSVSSSKKDRSLIVDNALKSISFIRDNALVL